MSISCLITQISTSTAPGDVDLLFSVMLVRKDNAAEEGTRRDT